jgi:protein regulator of cytokinesis 1
MMMQVEAEVSRLEELKGSKMKELVLKKRTELEEICRRTHLIAKSNTTLDKSIASMDPRKFD